MAEGDRAQDCAERALAAARSLGADAAQASVLQGSGQDVLVRLGELESLEHMRDQELSVRVYYGHRSGAASSTDLRAQALRDTVEAACTIARCAEADAAQGLPERDWLAFDPVDLDQEHVWEPSVEEATGIALACEDAARAHAGIATSDGARLTTGAQTVWLANSHGFFGKHARSEHYLSCCVVGERAGVRERDAWDTAHCDPEALEAPEAVGRRAAERTLRRLGAQGLSSRAVPVLFEAPAAVSLLGHFVAAASGTALYRGASFLLDCLDKPVWADHIRLVERPCLPRRLDSAPFDQEGVRTRERAIVEDGVLREWFMNSYSARRLGLEPTGNAGGARNLMLETTGEEQDFASLLRTMDKGLVVTEVMGDGANTVTGDYSLGAAGFWVEGGEIAHPVHEITIAGNLADMFRQVAAVGSDRDSRRANQTGSLLLERMQIAGA